MKWEGKMNKREKEGKKYGEQIILNKIGKKMSTEERKGRDRECDE